MICIFFLAACLCLDPDINSEIVRKLGPYGGLIGIYNSSLDTYLKSDKFLRLYVILHNASWFVSEHSQKGPVYSNVLSFSRFFLANACFGHTTGLLFCLFVKTSKRTLFNLMEC